MLRHERILGVVWTGNTTKHRTGARDDVVSKLKDGEHIIFRRSAREGRLWIGATLSTLRTWITVDNYLYEVMLTDKRRKVYFDIDVKDEKGLPARDPLSQAVAIIVERFPGARLHISGDPAHLVDKDEKKKYSYHIVLSNYYFNNHAEQGGMRPFCLEHLKSGFDPCVYGRNQSMKAINQSKNVKKTDTSPPPRRPQIYISGSLVLSKHLICHDFDDDAQDATTILPAPPLQRLRYRGTGGKNASIDVLGLPRLRLELPEDYDHEAALPHEKLELLPAASLPHDVCWTLVHWCRQVGLEFETFWDWYRDRTDDAEHRYKYEDYYEDTRYNVKLVTVDALLLHFYPTIRLSRRVLRMRQSFLDAQRDTAHTRTVPHEYLQSLDIDPKLKFTALTARMGGNKTGATIDYLKSPAASKGKRILWICPRITLSRDTYTRLQSVDMEFVIYLDVKNKKDDLESADNVVCSIQSIHYLARTYSIVVLDEVETILETFGGEAKLHGDRLGKNWENFMRILNSTEKIISMDALPTRSSMAFMRSVSPSSYEIVAPKQTTSKRKMCFIEDTQSFVALVGTAIAKGRKCFIFTPVIKGHNYAAKPLADVIALANGWTVGCEVLIYTGKDDAAKKTLTDVEKVWGDERVRCVITTSCISVGVNFNRKECFDQVFGVYQSHVPYREFFQALFRVRFPLDLTLYVLKLPFRAKSESRKPSWNVMPIKHRSEFDELSSNLLIEERVNTARDGFELFQGFAGIASKIVKAPRTTRANREAFWDLLAEANLAFKWENIPELTHEEFLRIGGLIDSKDVGLWDRIMWDKAIFLKRFRAETPHDTAMIDMWKRNSNFPVIVHEIENGGRRHLVRRILAENGVTLGEALPLYATCNTVPLKDIQEKYRFHHAPKQLRAQLVSRVLNVEFGRQVYGTEIPDPQQDTTRGISNSGQSNDENSDSSDTDGPSSNKRQKRRIGARVIKPYHTSREFMGDVKFCQQWSKNPSDSVWEL